LPGGDFNSKHTLWRSRLTTTKGRELAKVLQAKNYSYLSTGSPTYWPTDVNKIPDILDVFIVHGIYPTYADVESSFDLTSDLNPIIVTISTIIVIRRPAPRLYTSNTNSEIYKSEVRVKMSTTMNLETCEDIEIATSTFIGILRYAVKAATPKRNPSSPVSILSSDIKLLVATKRTARSKWQKPMLQMKDEYF